mmetsp:Transcript_7187/g.15633  ORF Transcript_7187/g.15633 Transcript_7187/m.15633 type:complete len:347 (+) Transcript_7187:77-1117(+)
MKRSYPTVLLLSGVRSNHGLDTSLTTGFAGTNKANGNIFTIKAKGGQSVSITSFDINMDGPPRPNPAPIEVHVLPGIDPGYYDPSSPYQLIYQDDVMGQGRGNVTTLPDFSSPVVIPAGATYSFYVTVANLQLGTHLWYNFGSGVGNIYAQDDDLEIGEGWALGYPFLGYSAPRKWNGNVYYTVESTPTTGSPTVLTMSPPTKTPTPTPVTSSPTVSLDEDLSEPTKSPVTQSPVQSPTESPNRHITESPSIDNFLRNPTNSPTASPSSPPSSSPSTNPTTASPSKQPSSDSPSYSPSSWGPTTSLDLFLPVAPAQPSSSITKGVYFGHRLCIVTALVVVATNCLF